MKNKIKLAPGQVWVDNQDGEEYIITSVDEKQGKAYYMGSKYCNSAPIKNFRNGASLKWIEHRIRVAYRAEYKYYTVDTDGTLLVFPDPPTINRDGDWCLLEGGASTENVDPEKSIVSCVTEKSERLVKIEALQKQLLELKRMEEKNE